MIKRWFVYIGRHGTSSPFRLAGTVNAMCEDLDIPAFPMFQGARQLAQKRWPKELIEVVEGGPVDRPTRIGNIPAQIGTVVQGQLDG